MYCLLLVVSTLVFVGLLIFPNHEVLAAVVGGIDFFSMMKVAGGK